MTVHCGFQIMKSGGKKQTREQILSPEVKTTLHKKIQISAGSKKKKSFKKCSNAQSSGARFVF